MMHPPARCTRITGARNWETRGMVLPPESPEGTSPAHADISDSHPQVLGDQISAVSAVQAVGLCYGNTRRSCDSVRALSAPRRPPWNVRKAHGMAVPPHPAPHLLLLTSLP